ncbi:hypothetical protein GCM10027290_16320 [Micromonospora sonneratiae]|uniref:Low temperature requirement A protein (LtrA) n=1 Tax=Micromonospora sonneratiae TaxID=1184706 RepID=A0ABW3YMX6_9ACTN
MRRVGVLAGLAIAALLVASPAQAFAHNAVHNAYLHTALDVLTLVAVTAPLWTAYAWGRERRGLLVALIAVVQLPVAVIGFVPIDNPVIHLAAFATALALTGLSLWTVRRARRLAAPAPTTGTTP